MQVFERRLVDFNGTFQIWSRKGGEWELVFERNTFREQYAPYARH